MISLFFGKKMVYKALIQFIWVSNQKIMLYQKPIDKKNQTHEVTMATINDIVLVHLEDEPIFFARIDSILPDAKKDWYHIKLLLLQIPLQVVTWLLKDEYINGHTFHMNDKKMRMEKVESPIEDLANLTPDNSLKKNVSNSQITFKSGSKSKSASKSDIKPGVQSPENSTKKTDSTVPENQTQAKIISFADLKKKHEPDSG
jgi:hypothetical protein